VVFVLSKNGVINLPGQGASFVGAGAAFVVDVLLSVIISLVTTPKRDEELKGLVYSLTPKSARTEATQEGDHGWYRKPTLLAGISLAMVIVLNIVFG
jgi:SSS family solute:Na+ symporter